MACLLPERGNIRNFGCWVQPVVEEKCLHRLADDGKSLIARTSCDRSRQSLGICTLGFESSKVTKRATNTCPM